MTAFVTVEGRTLAAAMKTINLVIQRRSSIPILAMVRLRIKDQAQLELVGTNLDMEIVTVLDVVDLGSADFDVCVSAKTLAMIAKQAGPAPVKITPSPASPEHKDKLNPDLVLVDVGDGDATYELQAQPSSDWLDFPDKGEWAPVETFTNGRLASILDRVAGCISTEETRYYPNGVCWQVNPFGRLMVATDGHRLSACTYGPSSDDVSSVIIPHSAVAILRRLGKGDVSVSQRDERRHLRFQIGATTLSSKTIDGTFPDWRRVIPKDVTHAIEFDAERLMAAVERVTPLSTEPGRAVRIFRDPDGMARVSVRNSDSGSGEAKTFAQWPTVPTNPNNPDRRGYVAGFDSFGFNASYLKAAIGTQPGKFTLRFADSSSPFIIDSGDEELTRVLMSMRV